METLKETNGNNSKSDNNDSSKDTEKAKSPTTKEDKKNAKKLADASPVTKFIGFYRINEDSLWGMHPQMLSSEESVINKIKLMYGKCDVHIINVEFPK